MSSNETVPAVLLKQVWSGGRKRDMKIDRGVVKGKKTAKLKREAHRS